MPGGKFDFHFRLELPLQRITDSDEATIQGWCYVAGEFPALLIRAKVISGSGIKKAEGQYDIPRPDVQRLAEGAAGPHCGFEVQVGLGLGANLVRLDGYVEGKWRAFHRFVIWRRIFRTQKKRILAGQETAWPADQPLVTVIMAAGAGAEKMAAAIDSIRAQTWQDYEIILVGGGWKEWAGKIPEARMIETGRGSEAAARNAGVGAARGKYVCCVGPGEKLGRTYLERCVFLLETARLDVCGAWRLEEGARYPAAPQGPFLFRELLAQNRMSAGAVFRRELWEAVGGFDEAAPAGGEDWEFWTSLARMGARGLAIPETLLFSSAAGERKEEGAVRNYIERKHGAAAWLEPAAVVAEREGMQKRWQFLGPRRGPRRAGRSILVAFPYATMGGAETIISQLIGHLTRQGFFVTLITTEPCPWGFGNSTGMLEESGAEVFHLPKFPRRVWKDFVFYLLKSRAIDILWQVASRFIYELLPAIHREANQIKVADLLFNTSGHTANNRKFAHFIDVHCVENAEVRAWLLAQGELPGRIALIPNGVDTAKYLPRRKEDAVAERAPEWKKKFVVGFFGRFSEEKGPDIFVRIAQRFRGQGGFQFLMAGAGPLESAVRGQAEELQLGEMLRTPGIMAVKDWIGCCDVVVVPSRLDGRPNIALESLASGVPVIAAAVGGLPEIVVDGECGYLCAAENVDAFAERIALLEKSPEALRQMKIQARKRAVEALSIEQMFASYLELFNGLLDAGESKKDASPLPALVP